LGLSHQAAYWFRGTQPPRALHREWHFVSISSVAKQWLTMAYMDRKTAKRWVIDGIVQGVGFRFFVQHKASALGLSGWVRNRDDGRVEVYAVGPTAKLNDLAAALHLGPRAAEVRNVEERDEAVESISGFAVR
jgi:acylphosphatase